MKRLLPTLALAAPAGGFCVRAPALNLMLPSPDVRFPEGFSARKAHAIEAVLGDKRFHYDERIYTHWPPDWSTTLVSHQAGRPRRDRSGCRE